ncbi:hypothetical protein LTR91_016217 [Friedmanniomyces endolithicus]|uniref:Uncharacterized protein n=1 Tax=Friedmanniomyces endolithicus TaxID=329885 RepID=A0AAN6QM31_9PEZI|nr:hypothetical protein LTR38_010144 [Friedmanniomyces endolithicus]KAK0804061.1 hypothetical protein LTR59_004507 [Friedmanniomyces endolithicus]KAK0819084.1 hypothetical protein LTR75_002288 [Friedmanniomyces endolithicus]KAK0851652.1 hypothetical protein LTR03_003909 [Friedmanniomyces endolithicus]KAK0869065.1 hypothetical protein LTS02_003265 [Friedmanniomyces endolithicus]
MTSPATQARSLYRRFLRELPTRTPSLLANPSPIQQHVRLDFAAAANGPTPSSDNTSSGLSSLQHQLQKPVEQRLEEAQQYIHYLRAQREYLTLLERYNPGVNFSEEEREGRDESSG